MIKEHKPCNYWTFEKCKEESLKYKTRTEFSIKSNGSYSASYRNGWLDNICEHMNTKGNRYHKCIYSYEFLDNSVYVGLTYNLDVRQKNRNSDKKDTVTKHINETNLQPIRKQLTDYINVDDAIKMEEFYVNKYKIEGWNILNKVKTGSIGGNVVKWTFEKCKEESLKYKTRTEFSIKSNGCYDRCIRNKWLNKVCNHMIPRQKPKNYWTFEKCKEESLKYKTKMDFHKNSRGSYNISYKNGWLNEFFK